MNEDNGSKPVTIVLDKDEVVFLLDLLDHYEKHIPQMFATSTLSSVYEVQAVHALRGKLSLGKTG